LQIGFADYKYSRIHPSLGYVTSDKFVQQLAEHHKQQGEMYEKEARDLVRLGNFEESVQKFELAAEQYSEAATYYREVHDYWNTAEYNERASTTHEQSATIHSELNNLSNSILYYFLSDKFNAH
jgi:hypothetical protein